MRDYIKLSPSVWQSKRFKDLPDDEKCFYLYCISSPHVNSAGYYRIHIGYMMADLNWDQKKIESCIKSIRKTGLIDYNFDDHILLIDKWFDHNPPTNPKHSIKVFSDILSIVYNELRDRALYNFIKCLEEKGWDLPDKQQQILDSLSIGVRRERETETERERETESKKEERKETKSPPLLEACDLYNLMAEKTGIPKMQKLSDRRKKMLKARMKDLDGIEGWKKLLEKVERSPFLIGKNDRNWTADFDFCITESTSIKIMEGKYDEKIGSINRQSTKTDRARASIQKGLDAIPSPETDRYEGRSEGES